MDRCVERHAQQQRVSIGTAHSGAPPDETRNMDDSLGLPSLLLAQSTSSR